MNAVIALLGGVRATVWFGLLLVVAILLGVSSCRLSREQAKGAGMKGTIANFEEAQRANLVKLDQCIHDFNVLAEQRRIEKDANAQAIRSLDSANAKAAAKAEQLRAEVEKLYAQDSDARTWGATGVDANVAATLPGGRR